MIFLLTIAKRKKEAAMTVQPTTFSTIGQRTRLVEGEAKVTGKTRFVADLKIAGMVHGRFVTSPHAHARILHIDTTAAKALPGVVAVFTAPDLPAIAPISRQRLLLARRRVIFVGQPVALILAESEAIAEDALEQVIVEYEPLRAAITLEEALAPNAPLVWPGASRGKQRKRPRMAPMSATRRSMRPNRPTLPIKPNLTAAIWSLVLPKPM